MPDWTNLRLHLDDDGSYLDAVDVGALGSGGRGDRHQEHFLLTEVTVKE